MNTIEEVYELIEELPDEEILFEKGTKYQFVHSLVRNTLYDSLRKREKILLHHKIAEILEDLHKDNLDNIAAKLATHYELARDYNKAAYYYSRLAKNDNKKHAIENARKAANKGLELIKKLGRKANIENQIRLLLELGNAEVINGTLTEAAKYFEQVKPLITDKTNKTKILIINPFITIFIMLKNHYKSEVFYCIEKSSVSCAKVVYKWQ